MFSKGFGGAERYFVDLTRALAGRGHAVQAICHEAFSRLAELRAIPNVHSETVSPLGWWDMFAGHRLCSLIARQRPEVVQAHLARAAYLAGKCCARLRVPLVVKTHNYVDMKYYSRVQCFIATTEDQERYLQEQGVDSGRIRVIPNFSSLPAMAGITTAPGPVVNIASYGRLVRKKGFHVLIEAMRILRVAGVQARLHLGGDGPERRSLQRLVERHQLDRQVVFHGWIDDVREFAHAADIFVLPSLDEPFGIVVLEMMALGKPIVATRTQGPLEILDDSTAWLVAPGEAEELANALRAAISREQERTGKAARALDLFREKYTEDVVVPQLVSVYESLAGAARDTGLE